MDIDLLDSHGEYIETVRFPVDEARDMQTMAAAEGISIPELILLALERAVMVYSLDGQ